MVSRASPATSSIEELKSPGNAVIGVRTVQPLGQKRLGEWLTAG